MNVIIHRSYNMWFYGTKGVTNCCYSFKIHIEAKSSSQGQSGCLYKGRVDFGRIDESSGQIHESWGEVVSHRGQSVTHRVTVTTWLRWTLRREFNPRVARRQRT